MRACASNRFAIGAVAALLGIVVSHAEQLHKVVRSAVRDDGLVAIYLRPKGEVVRPAMIVLGGSDGGIGSTESLGYRFAERGWAVLAVAYFGMETLPEKLANIPLEYFDRAASWVVRQPLVQTKGLAVVGVSRGAELALLLAAHNSLFNRVVAYVPSHVVWGPVGVFDKSISAWTIKGQALPYVPQARQPDYSAKPYRGTPDFLVALREKTAVETATIPVERIQGAVLLLSGGDDQVWPSTLMSSRIIKRLEAARHPFRFEHLSFPEAGHLISPGSNPGLLEAKHPTGVIMAFGGTKKANREAQEKSWARVLEFLGTGIQQTPLTAK